MLARNCILPERKHGGSRLRGAKVLITGAEGMLGYACRAVLANDYPTTSVHAYGRQFLDVTRRDTVLALRSQDFNFIIHCAAVTNADDCEVFQDYCYETQVQGTRNLLELAVASRAKVFYPQTFLIFDGSDNEIDENTTPNPLSVYAKYKLEAERQILASQVESTVVRMAGFFGGDERDKNFVGKFTRHLASMIKDGTNTYAVGNRIWQPTYTVDLARNSLLLLDQGCDGVWNMASDGEVSFFNIARECVRLLRLEDRIRIVPAQQQQINNEDVAVRPERAVLSNARLRKHGLYFQRHWQEALAEYLNRPWFRSLFPHAPFQ